MVCLFPNCGSGLPADLRKTILLLFSTTIIIFTRNTNITGFASKSEIPDHMCVTQDTPPPTQPWWTCSWVRPGFLHYVELVPLVWLSSSGLLCCWGSEKQMETLACCAWRTEGRGTHCFLHGLPLLSADSSLHLLYWISFMKPEKLRGLWDSLLPIQLLPLSTSWNVKWKMPITFKCFRIAKL